MRMLLLSFLVLLPVLAMAQAPGSLIKRTNPPTLSPPNGFSQVVEVTGPARTIYVAGQLALDAGVAAQQGKPCAALVGVLWKGLLHEVKQRCSGHGSCSSEIHLPCIITCRRPTSTR